MNESDKHPGEGLLTTSQLAERPDFTIGLASVSPSARIISGPGGTTDVEPRVMQVLVVLADAAGRVVTRETLFERCWGGVYVGDDSLNRVIAALRRLASEVAEDSFKIETITRTGYRLTGETHGLDASHEQDERGSPGISRRALVGSGLALATSAGASLWWVSRPLPNARFDTLMKQGEVALCLDEPAGKYFGQAVAIDPGNAKALGLMAYSIASGGDMGPSTVPSSVTVTAEQAARRALRIDSTEPYALLTMTIIQSGALDWLSREKNCRRILTIAPENTLAMRELRLLMHGVGRCNEALAISERAIAIEPLCPDHQLRKAMQLWIHGRIPEADRIIDHAMELWPTHRLVRMARLMIYAFTGRADAALAMVSDEEQNPILLSAAATTVWRKSLMALENPNASTIAAAREANLEGSRTTPAVAAWAILVLSTLGELDAAFEVANGFLLGRGSLIVQPKPDPKLPTLSHLGWRNTHGLFAPPTKPLRLDARFRSLADGLGLTDYWRRRGAGPDAFLFKA